MSVRGDDREHAAARLADRVRGTLGGARRVSIEPLGNRVNRIGESYG